MKIKQAVILCGGLGSRLLPYTKETPKPMVLCNNKPFLFYLLDFLSNQGIKNFLLLTGYLNDKINYYFSDGKPFGWKIQYSNGPVDWGTAKRIWEAKSKIDSNFLLLYSDNFLVVDIKKIIFEHFNSDKTITFTIVKKKDGNVILDKKSNLVSYNENKISSKKSFVELGFMIINKEKLLHYMDSKNVMFSNILKKISLKRDLNHYLYKGFYYSISDPERYFLTEKFLKHKKILLLDRDGTINKKAEKARYIENWDEFNFIDDTLKGLNILSNLGFSFIVITNQAGIGKGIVKKEDVDDIHKKMTQKLKEEGINILKVYYCPHHWEDNCDCRKPKANLFHLASKEYSFRLDKVIYVGDDPRDMLASANAFCSGIFLGEKKELKNGNDKHILNIDSSFQKSLNIIKKFYKN